MQNSFCEPCRAELIRGNICSHMLPSDIIKNTVRHHLNFFIWNLFCFLLLHWLPTELRKYSLISQKFKNFKAHLCSEDLIQLPQKGLNVPGNVDLPPPALLFSDTLHCNPRSGRSSHFLQHSNAASCHFSSCKNHQGRRKRSTKQKHGWVCGFHLIKNRTGFNTVFICTQ